MKKNIITVALIIVFSAGSVTYGEFMVVKSPESVKESIIIPPAAYEYISQEELVEILCYETKWKGGEGLARVEALEESLSPVTGDLEKLGFSTANYNLSSSSVSMREKIDAVCSAKSVEDALREIDEYITLANKIRNDLEGSFATDLRGIEVKLREQGEALKKKLEKELGEESVALKTEAERKIREDAEKEADSLETQLRQLGSEFESFMSSGDRGLGEARAKANELAGRISADAETSAFLSRKFNELLSEATKVFPQVASGQMTPAQVKNMVTQKVPSVVEEIKSFMKGKYENIAKAEEARIREMLEKKADEIGGEERRSLEKIKDVFENIESEFEALYRKKLVEFEPYKEKAEGKKRELVIKAVDSHFDEAKKLIEERKGDIETAFAAGVAEEFGIISYEEMIRMIEKDRGEIISEFTKTEPTAEKIAQVKAKFNSKWNDYRQKVEAIEIVGDGTLGAIAEKIRQNTPDNWHNLIWSVNNVYLPNLSTLDYYLSRAQEYKNYCLENERATDVSFVNETGQGDRKKLLEARVNCRHCMTLNELGGKGEDFLKEVKPEEVKKRASDLEKDINRLNEIRTSYSNNRTLPIKDAPIPLSELFEVRDRLNENFEYFDNIRVRAKEIESIFRPSWERASKVCWGK